MLADGGAVGRVEAVGPFSSTVVLMTDYTSQIPAVVREGRWWGIARGNLSSVRFDYVSQDARLRLGEVVVTGEGRSFHAGVPIGTIVRVDRGVSSLYQSASLKPAVDLDALDRVVVVPKYDLHEAPFVGPPWWVAGGWLALALLAQVTVLHFVAIRNVEPSLVIVAVVWYADARGRAAAPPSTG